MNKIKVLQFPIRSTNGGITHYALQNWKFIDKTKFDFDFCAIKNRVPIEDEIIRSGAGMKYISCYAEENEERFSKEFRDLFERNQYDVIHLHTSYWKSFLVEKIAIECGVPKIIVHSHSTRIDNNDEQKRKQEEIVHNICKAEFNTSLATDFCACSRAAADWLFGEQIPRKAIKILNNAINVDEFSFNPEIRDQYRKQLGLSNSFVIGNVGRICFQKNQEFLIDVLYELQNYIENVKLLLIGDGPLKNDLIIKINKLGLKDRVILLGMRNDVAELMDAMDIFCLPSRFEGLGIVLIEAQASGLKCLASSKVPKEAKLTDNVEFVSLDCKLWTRKIIESNVENYRTSDIHIITEKGYNINYQIKEVEKIYSNDIISQ